MAKTKKQSKKVSGAKKTAKKTTKKKPTPKAEAAKKAKVTKPSQKASKKSTAKASKVAKAKTSVKGSQVKGAKIKVAEAKTAKVKPTKGSPQPSLKMSAKAKAKKPMTGSKGKSTKAREFSNLEGLFTPLDDRLIVLLEGVSEQTAGGIIIPGNAEAERPNRGEVVAVGRGHLNQKGKVKPLDVRAGDKILFGPYSGTQVRLGKVETIILRESEVLGIVES